VFILQTKKEKRCWLRICTNASTPPLQSKNAIKKRPKQEPDYAKHTQKEARSISPYPTVMTTKNVMILAGIPLVRKCLTCKYLCPV
jgi:hypothetical protein